MHIPISQEIADHGLDLKVFHSPCTQTAGRGFLLDNKKKQPTSFVNIAKKNRRYKVLLSGGKGKIKQKVIPQKGWRKPRGLLRQSL